MLNRKYNNFVQIKHCVLSVNEEMKKLKLFEIAQCYYSDHCFLFVIGNNENELEEITKYLIGKGVWAFKLTKETIADIKKPFRIPVTTLHFIAKNYEHFRAPSVIINFNLNFNRVKFLERFIHYHARHSNKFTADIFHIGSVNTPESIAFTQFFE